MSWSEFFVITNDIFGEDAAGPDTYKNHFMKTKEAEEEQIPGQMEIQDYPEVLPKKEQIAPAQKVEKTAETPNVSDVSEEPKREKTEEQKYDEEQAEIDRQTKKKLQEMEDEKKMEVLPSEMPKPTHQIRLAKMYFDDVASGKKSFELRKNDRNYKMGDTLELMEFDEGKYTGRSIRAEVTYMLEDYTGLTDGYCIMAIKVMGEIEE